MIGSLALLLVTLIILLMGVPVGLALAGAALLVTAGGIILGGFDPALLITIPGRLFSIFTNDVFVAIPLFVLMGVIIERSGLAQTVFQNLAQRLSHWPGGLGVAVVLAGGLLAAVTGIVGASVIALGLIALKPLRDHGYRSDQAAGIVCAAGTLGQIIPPSIVLLLLADIMQTANSEAQLALGNFAPDPISVVDLFAGALIPGVVLVLSYSVWLWLGGRQQNRASEIATSQVDHSTSSANSPWAGPLLAGLAILVLGSILGGVATVSEAASIGALGAVAIAWFSGAELRLGEVAARALLIASSVFFILVGASIWSLVLRGFGGDLLIRSWLEALPGGLLGALFVVMALIFILGFVLELIEILLIVVPLTAPALIILGADPLWLGLLIALNLQTSFLTPPMGVALFYLRSVAPKDVTTTQIYRGVVPFVLLQLAVLGLVAALPGLATWLPLLLTGL